MNIFKDRLNKVLGPQPGFIFKPDEEVDISVENLPAKGLAATALYLAAILTAAFFSAGNDISIALFRLINQDFWHPAGGIILTFMEVGSTPAVVLIAIMLLVLRRWRAAGTLILAGAVSGILANTAKTFAHFRRPFLVLEDAVLRTHVDERTLEIVVNANGFPSGHTAAATLVATTLWPHVTAPIRWLLAALVVITGIGRVYAGVHFPLDVAGGFAQGLLLGLAARHFWPKNWPKTAYKK